MISFLKGCIEEKSEKSIFLDVNGVGYEDYMPTGSASMMPSVGEEVKIHTYLQISENGIGLYGFLTKDELNVFKLLITVSGIGPKGAVGILSAAGFPHHPAKHPAKSRQGKPGDLSQGAWPAVRRCLPAPSGSPPRWFPRFF